MSQAQAMPSSLAWWQFLRVQGQEYGWGKPLASRVTSSLVSLCTVDLPSHVWLVGHMASSIQVGIFPGAPASARVTLCEEVTSLSLRTSPANSVWEQNIGTLLLLPELTLSCQRYEPFQAAPSLQSILCWWSALILLVSSLDPAPKFLETWALSPVSRVPPSPFFI